MFGYPLFITGFVLCTNPYLFKFKIANELSEFRNYLFVKHKNFILFSCKFQRYYTIFK